MFSSVPTSADSSMPKVFTLVFSILPSPIGFYFSLGTFPSLIFYTHSILVGFSLTPISPLCDPLLVQEAQQVTVVVQSLPGILGQEVVCEKHLL